MSTSFISMAQWALVLNGLLVIETLRSHPFMNTTPDNAKHSQETNIQVLGGIRTYSSRKLATADRAVTGIGCVFVCFRKNSEQFDLAETNEIKLHVQSFLWQAYTCSSLKKLYCFRTKRRVTSHRRFYEIFNTLLCSEPFISSISHPLYTSF
jgi:hypothetical protein